MSSNDPATEPQSIALDDLLSTYRPAYHDTWDEAFTALTSNPSDKATIDALLEVLAAGKTFHTPVVLDHTEQYVRNGMHRITAAALAGVPAVTAVGQYPPPPDSGQVLDVAFTLVPAGDTATSFDAAIEFAFEWLGSLGLDEETWANCDIMSSSRTPAAHARIEGTWYVPHRRADDLVAALRVRSAEHLWALNDVSVTLSIDLEDD